MKERIRLATPFSKLVFQSGNLIVDEDKKSLFINAVDKEMHASILRFEQKLRGLQAEIEAKEEALTHESDQTLVSQSRAQLTVLSAEVQKVLASIKGLVNLTVDEGFSAGHYVQSNREELEEFRKTIQDNIDIISLLKDKF